MAIASSAYAVNKHLCQTYSDSKRGVLWETATNLQTNKTFKKKISCSLFQTLSPGVQNIYVLISGIYDSIYYSSVEKNKAHAFKQYSIKLSK